MSNLFPKLLVLIIALALIALSLLVIRQERYLAAAALTQHHRELQETQRQVWELQAELARRITPERLRDMAERHGLSAPRPRSRGTAFVVRVLHPHLSEQAARTVATGEPPRHSGAELALVALTSEERAKESADE